MVPKRGLLANADQLSNKQFDDRQNEIKIQWKPDALESENNEVNMSRRSFTPEFRISP